MKINRILPFAVCGALLFASCDDDKMDWHTPEGHTPISSIDEIPLSTDESMANYKFIKEYMAEYMPGVTIGLGLGADKFLEDEQYQKVAANNFQQFVTGNAMKFGSVCKSNGKLDFTKIDNFIDKAKELNPDVKIFGHNLLWHTQQPQTYLKSLISPDVKVIADGDDSGIENLCTNSDFDTETGWAQNGSYHTGSIVEDSDADRGKVMKLEVSSLSDDNWKSQVFYTFSSILEVGEEYKYEFWAKTDGNCKIQLCGQGNPYNACSQYYGSTYTLTNSWMKYEGTVTLGADNDQIVKMGFQFGGEETVLYIDGFKFGKEKSGPTNLCLNPSFDTETGWAQNGSYHTGSIVEDLDADRGKVMKIEVSSLSNANWKSQMFYKFANIFDETKTYVCSFWAKTDDACKIQICGQGDPYDACDQYYGKEYTLTTSWMQYKTEINFSETNNLIQKLGFQFGGAEATLYFDDFVIYEKEASSKRALSKASTVVYTFKTLDEKQTALLGAMETWITDMVSHCKEKGNVTEWDVLNEAIGDDSKIRGVDGGFMSDDGQPTESETDGLNLNWASDHFYWGYFLGKDYAVKAFQFARAAAGDDAKLYINDYNLETSDSKLEALINYVKYIDETNGSAIVDGIGTQMHIMSFNPDDTKNDAAKEGIKNMFTKLASTGKLVRISELDVAFSYTHDDETKVNPSAEQLQAQADTYKFVIEQYKAIIPTEQQGGICIWTLTDADDEHEYWLKGDKPNLFNADYSRKPAYKGVCDGIAGKDLSAEFNGSQWSN